MTRRKRKPKPPEPPTFRLLDTHCHLDHMANASELPAQAREREIGICCATVTPAEYRAARERFAGEPNVCVGVGLHPWWIADDRCGDRELDELVLLLREAYFVSEIGIDLGGKRAPTRDRQILAFETIVRACAEHPKEGRVLSIHAVRAAEDALDVLERFGLPLQTPCIFHWFSGTSDDFTRARRLGCYFSVNDYMLNAKKGREYLRIAPEDRLLLESDMPDVFDQPYPIEDWERFLVSAQTRLAELRGCDPEELGAKMAETGNRLFTRAFAR